jgi:hypothetical protein
MKPTCFCPLIERFDWAEQGSFDALSTVWSIERNTGMFEQGRVACEVWCDSSKTIATTVTTGRSHLTHSGCVELRGNELAMPAENRFRRDHQSDLEHLK